MARIPAVNPSDSELVALAQRGDSQAFDSLVYRYNPKIFRFFCRMTRNGTLAEDLTQDAWLQVWRSIRGFQGRAAFGTWLYVIALNAVRMHFRKKSSDPELMISLDSLDHASEVNIQWLRERRTSVYDEKQSRTPERLDIIRAIKELPQGYRTVFILHEVKGLDHQEIARLMGCSIGTSKSQTARAKTRLRKKLGNPFAISRA